VHLTSHTPHKQPICRSLTEIVEETSQGFFAALAPTPGQATPSGNQTMSLPAYRSPTGIQLMDRSESP
jgi:hypothetical protein